jgi:drug/metabolite transporter (DMT)-like permease
MQTADYLRLVFLAAIWGGSFIFQRVAAPVLGAVAVAEGRLLIAGLVLSLWFRLTGFDPDWRRHWKQYIAIGMVNMALPSLLYGFAMMHVPAALAAILNSTSPMFGALFAALFLGERLTARKIAGCAAGASGVALIAQPGGFASTPMFATAVAACLAACVCYGYTGVVMRKFAAQTPSRGVAVGSQLTGAAMLLPLLAFLPPPAEPTVLALSNLLALALLGNALGMVLYFRLITDTGATRALTVTYLMPLFAVLWGMLFLGESLPASALAGGALILAGTVLVTRG